MPAAAKGLARISERRRGRPSNVKPDGGLKAARAYVCAQKVWSRCWLTARAEVPTYRYEGGSSTLEGMPCLSATPTVPAASFQHGEKTGKGTQLAKKGKQPSHDNIRRLY